MSLADGTDADFSSIADADFSSTVGGGDESEPIIPPQVTQMIAEDDQPGLEALENAQLTAMLAESIECEPPRH